MKSDWGHHVEKLTLEPMNIRGRRVKIRIFCDRKGELKVVLINQLKVWNKKGVQLLEPEKCMATYMIPMAQCKNENVWPLFQKQEKSVVIDTKTSFNGFSLILLWSFFKIFFLLLLCSLGLGILGEGQIFTGSGTPTWQLSRACLSSDTVPWLEQRNQSLLPISSHTYPRWTNESKDALCPDSVLDQSWVGGSHLQSHPLNALSLPACMGPAVAITC